jgi:hypothetical protein
MAIATGVAKQLVYKKETSWGTAAGASGAQILRYKTSDLSLNKDTYQSDEIRTDYQISDFRHGVRRVEGTISGELSPGTYKEFFAAALRKDFASGATTGAVAVIAVTTTGTKYVRSTGSFITNGFKIGDVVAAAGFTEANNNSHYGIITALSATDMTVYTLDGVALTDEAEGDTVTLAVVGKKSYTPTTGHTDDSFSIEHWYSDIAESELYTGCKVNQVDVNLPPTGMATVDFGVMGKDVTTNASSQYFSSPTAATTAGVLAAVNGVAFAIGTRQTVLTGLTITVAGNMTSDPVVGSNTVPDIFEGRVVVSGEMSVFFEDGTFRDAFLNEDEVALMFVFTTGNSKNADFVSFVMPRVKFGGSAKSGGEQGQSQTVPYQALFNGSGGSGTTSEQTTLVIQDSLA